MKKLLTILFAVALGLNLSAQITSITYEVDTIFGSGAIDNWGESLEGFVTYEIYAEFTNPDDKMIAIYADPSLETLYVDAPCGCYNPLIGDVLLGADINSLFFEFYPSIEFDTYWTLGFPVTESFVANEWGAEFYSTTMCSAVVADGVIFTTAEYAVEAGPDLRMKIAQITTCDSFELNACFEVWVEGVSPGGNSDHPGAYCMSEDGDGPLFVDVMLAGCMDESACNFIPSASLEDDSCQYPNDGYDCEGLCLIDFDGDGICDEFEISGCVDTSACNYNSDATDDDGSCIPSGCMETAACNYNELAECEGEECVYSCCPGPGCCLEGTTWDADLGGCIPTESSCPEDLDFDGVVGVNDLMELLSSFGMMCEEPETGEFTCGDPMNYHGYDYATVQIGEQCWFAENCRYLAAVSPPSLGFEDDSLAHAYVQAYDGASVDEAMTMENYALHGVLYNQLAAESWDICPTGWHVPVDANIPQQGDFEELKLSLPADAAGTALKASPTDVPPWDGNNSSGFKGISSGARSLYWDGEFSWLDITAFYWSQSGWSRRLDSNDENLSLMGLGPAWGLSVRCVRD